MLRRHPSFDLQPSSSKIPKPVDSTLRISGTPDPELPHTALGQ